MDKNIYYNWKKSNLEKGMYFIIFNEFVDQKILKNISGGALKLYIYFGLNTFYVYGSSYNNQSVKEIADYFNKSERTINNWIQALEKMKLIKRHRESIKDHSKTQLIPYNLNIKSGKIKETVSYYEWIKIARKENKLFFPIFPNFQDKGYLRLISGEALKLYIFLGIYSKYNNGESWYSIASISNYFDKSERTVSYWIQELKELNLIYRHQIYLNQSSRTYLQKY